MNYVKKTFVLTFLFVFFLIPEYSSAQLVNIESRRIQTDSVRFTLTDNFTFTHNDNNGATLLQFDNSLASQYKTKNLRNIFLILGSYKLIRTKEEDFMNVLFAHVRFNRKITKLLRFESFVQYQNNPVLDINARELIGSGFRFKFISTKHFWAYLGTTYMYEYERSEKYDQTNKHHRSSNYLSFTTNIPKSDLNITGTFYYQPEFGFIEDYRVLSEIRLSYKVSKHIALVSGFNYFRDSKTPSGGNQYFSQTKLGLGFSW